VVAIAIEIEMMRHEPVSFSLKRVKTPCTAKVLKQRAAAAV
jgi:hypothetical protein